jgi:CDP-glycerol glycerophosphotransferase
MDRFDMMLDLEELRKALADEYVILVRPHYFVADKYEMPEDGTFVFDGGRTGKIEDLFPITDILITDYSSVMFDFALTEKPMIFFAYDLEEYTGDTRGAYFDISTEAPGALSKTTAEVIDAVRNIDSHYEINGRRIDSFRSKYLTYETEDSAAKVYRAVFEDDLRKRHKPLRRLMFSAIRHLTSEKRYNRLRKKYVRRLLHSAH